MYTFTLCVYFIVRERKTDNKVRKYTLVAKYFSAIRHSEMLNVVTTDIQTVNMFRYSSV
jgi:hypothetical protein